jgi:lactoylglutathione lyase
MTPTEIVLAFHEGASRREESALDLIADDFIQHAAGPQGRGGFRQTLEALRHDLDEPTTVIERVVAQDDLVVVQLTMHGRHVASTMPLLVGLPPTGNEIEWNFIHIWRVANGVIAEHWACRDDIGFLAQVGGWPPPR